MPGAGATERFLCGEGSVPVARKERCEDYLGGQGMLRGGGRGRRGGGGVQASPTQTVSPTPPPSSQNWDAPQEGVGT